MLEKVFIKIKTCFVDTYFQGQGKLRSNYSEIFMAKNKYRKEINNYVRGSFLGLHHSMQKRKLALFDSQV